MKIRVLAYVLLAACCLSAQKRHFYWQEACFNNPAAPYCPGHEYAVKRTKPGAAKGGTNAAGALWTPETVDANGIDWRFADPSADALAVLNCRGLLTSPVAHTLVEQLGAKRGMNSAQIQKTFRALSGVEEVAFSGRDDRLVVLVTGRTPDSILPAPEPGWKAVALAGNAVLLGHADAVDEAVTRLAKDSALGELAGMALDRQADGQFWAAGSAKLAAHEGTTGVKRIWMTASLGDRLTSDTAFEFEKAPDSAAIQPWLSTLGDSKLDGSMVYAKMSLEPDDMRRNIDTVASSLLGQRLQVLIQAAPYLPVRDTAGAKHTRPVVYGLDEGAKEVR